MVFFCSNFCGEVGTKFQVSSKFFNLIKPACYAVFAVMQGGSCAKVLLLVGRLLVLPFDGAKRALEVNPDADGCVPWADEIFYGQRPEIVSAEVSE